MPNERILILEDHNELREETRQILVDAGYSVQTAASCAEAVAHAQSEHFDVIVADIFLPDGSGIEAFRNIQRNHAEVAGVVITGYSSWEVAMEALRAGFMGFVVKPFMPEQLIATIVSALEQERLRRENARLRAIVPLYELSRAFMGTVELNDLVKQIIETARQETRADNVSLMLLDDDCRELRIAAATSLTAEIVQTERREIGHGIAGRVAQRGEPILIAEGVPLDPEIREVLGARPEILSALSLPLTARGQVIGVLNLTRERGGESFTHGDLEVATVLATQVAASIDNARLFNRLKQLSEVSQTLARTMDLDEAIAATLAAPVQLVNARGTALWLIDSSLAPRLAGTLGLGTLRVPELKDRSPEENFRPDGTGGWVTVPFRKGEKTLGALMVRLASPNPPGEERLRVLRTLAHTASAILESHRLRAREETAFREMDRAMREDLSARELLERLLQQMMSACSAEGGAIFLWDAERNHVEPWVKAGDAPSDVLARTIIREGRAASFQGEPPRPAYAIGAPMRVGSRVHGAVVLTRSIQAGGFRTRQLNLLSTLTSSAALVVRNTQLYARSEEAAISEERTRIAREIHDGLAQDLAFLVLKASAAQKLLSRGEERGLQKELREITDQLRQDAREVRRVIFALRPLDIEALGFLPALDKFIQGFSQANEVQVEFQMRGDFSRLPPKLETALFRLVQEALNNVRKHAHAHHAWVELECDERQAFLRIRDDGQGFDVSEARRVALMRGSLGLIQMQERAERAGGKFSITSLPGEGTGIEATLPVREL